MTEGLPFKATRAPPSTPTSLPISLTFPVHSGSTAGLIAQISLNSPGNLNALRAEDIQTLIATVEWVNEQPDIIITVLTATGRFFSSGANVADPARHLPADLTALSPSDPLYHSRLNQFYAQKAYNNNSRFARCLYDHDKLLVAALNGPAVGITAAGLAYCDLVYCFEDFWLATPFTSLALVAEGGASKTFVEKMGLGRAQQALLEGRRMPASELLEAGFVSKIFPTPSPPAEADKKLYTPPIMDFVLPHLTSKLLPPTADSFALLYTKKLIRNATYEGKSWTEVNDAEVLGAAKVFTSGRPIKQFERLATPMCGRFSNAQPVYQYTATVENQIHRRRENEEREGNAASSHASKTSQGSSGNAKDTALPFHAALSEEDYYPTHNVSPSSRVPVLRLQTPVPLPSGGASDDQSTKGNGLVMECMRWGLLPAYTTSIPRGADALRTINARDDSVLSGQSMWTPLLRKGKRCVVFCQGFYEWLKKPDGSRIAHFVGMQDEGSGRTDVNGRQKALMPMAGLYEKCTIDKQEVYSFTVITTESNTQLNFLHDRMPVILPDPDSIIAWLGYGSASSKQVCSLLKPYNVGKLDVYPVPREVGKVGNDDKNFILPVSSRKDGIAAAFGKVKKAGGEDVNSETHAPMAEEVKAVDGTGKRKRESDEELARKLQKEEEVNVQQQEQNRSAIKAEAGTENSSVKADEEFAKKLQSEEESMVVKAEGRKSKEDGNIEGEGGLMKGEEDNGSKGEPERAEPSKDEHQASSSKFSPEPYNPPVSPPRPNGGFSTSDATPSRSASRRPAPTSKKLEEAAKGTKDIRKFFG
ncbi:hypothetical protein CBS101457_003471 [Exobasidium rhododendri]|nr:hypothetical protein CBS101457_003471 [Exobasidium rhododendri]